MRRHRHEDGQSAVELLAVIPALVLIGLTAWWIAVAAHTWTTAAGAARAGARAAEVGAPVTDAALSVLPPGYAHGARVVADPDGAVRARLDVPRVVPFLPPERLTARSGDRP